MSVVRVEPGLAILSMPLTEDLRGYFEGSIHGGMLATLADAASASCLDGAYDFQFAFPRDDRYSRPLLPAAQRRPTRRRGQISARR